LVKSLYTNCGKRFFDIITSYFLIIFFSPIIILIYLLILISKENPIFKQKRVGLDRKMFKIYKFRTLASNTSNIESKKIKNIKYIFLGKILRRTNLDELPQLFNIAKGDMSLIGPRPCLKNQRKLIQIRNKEKIFKLKPGLTGLAQVNSYDNMSDLIKVKYEKKYLTNISFIYDIIIIIKTFKYLLKQPPKY